MEEKEAFMVSSSGARNFYIEQTTNKIDIENEGEDLKDDDDDSDGLFLKQSEQHMLASNQLRLWKIGFPEDLPTIQENQEPAKVETTIQETVVQTEILVSSSDQVCTVVETESIIQETKNGTNVE